MHSDPGNVVGLSRPVKCDDEDTVAYLQVLHALRSKDITFIHVSITASTPPDFDPVRSGGQFIRTCAVV